MVKAGKKTRKLTPAEPAATPACAADTFVKGDAVLHPKFGKGTITAVEPGRLTIAFKSVGTKIIQESYVKPG